MRLIWSHCGGYESNRMPLAHFISFPGFLGFIFLLGTSLARGFKHKTCDFNQCLSPQLKGSSRSRDKQTVCRLLSPSVHCLLEEEPICRKELGRDSHMYAVFVKNLDNYKKQYADLCGTYYTTCTEVAKCLHPKMQIAAHKQDVTFLCNNVHTVIECFEKAIHNCRVHKQTQYNNANFELLASYVDRLRHQASARCDGSSVLFGKRSHMILLATSMMLFLLGVFYGHQIVL